MTHQARPLALQHVFVLIVQISMSRRTDTMCETHDPYLAGTWWVNRKELSTGTFL